MCDSNACIGVFDSGVGGLTVVKAIREILGCESLLYLGDTARVPYGNKDSRTIERYSLGCARLLVERGVKALVIACNTASAHALESIREAFSLPVVGVIEPVSLYAYGCSSRKRIGVIGTRGTVSSGAYERSLKAVSHGGVLEVFSQACPMFVPLVEEGWGEDVISYEICRRYLEWFRGRGVDTMILGCTHYPVLRKVIERVLVEMGEEMLLCDCGSPTAYYLREMLEERGLLSSSGRGELNCMVSDDPEWFRDVAEMMLRYEVGDVEHVHIQAS